MQVQVSQENLLDVAGPSGGGHHTRSASVRSSHSNNLLQVKIWKFDISLFKIRILIFSRTHPTLWWRETGTGQTWRIPGQLWAGGRVTPPLTTAETAASGTGRETGEESLVITLWSLWSLISDHVITHQACELKRKEIVILVKLMINPISTLLTTVNSLSDPRIQPKAKPWTHSSQHT